MHQLSGKRKLATLALLCCALPTGLPAQRVIRETAAEWNRAKALMLHSTVRWCASAESAGCDFRSIDNAMLLPDGGIVASSVPGPLRHFSADGKLVATLARKGQGPGEYGFIAQPQLVADRVVWFDNTQMRIASISLANVPGRVMPNTLPMTTGMIYMVADTLVVLDIPASNTVGEMVDAVYRTVPLAGTPRVLARVRTPAKFTPGSNFTQMSAPFAPRVVADVGADGTVAHSNGAAYVVEVFPARGGAWRIESESPTRAVTQSDRDSVINATLKIFRAPGVAALPPAARAQLENMDQRTFPPLSVIRVLRDGTVWILPVSLARETSARWDVFSADGTRLGQARLPARARVQDGTRDWILVVQLDDDDVPSVVKYTVR